MKHWTPKPELYDFGRPFPEQKVNALLEPLWGNCDGCSLKVFEPGCGTGRILTPLAQRYSTWHFLGMDSSPGALSVCQGRCSSRGNVRLIEGQLPESMPSESFDMVIHSSVLHAVPDWQTAMAELSSRLVNGGVFCLIGDSGDIYDAALGRKTRPGIDKALVEFWNHYLELRQRFNAPSPESSQIGCRWDLESSDLANWLEKNQFTEVQRSQVNWDEEFSLSTLMKIVEERCYSSMFTVEKEIFDKVIAQLRIDLPSLGIKSATSRHQAVARFFTRKVAAERKTQL